MVLVSCERPRKKEERKAADYEQEPNYCDTLELNLL
jgi:hypothetical protein